MKAAELLEAASAYVDNKKVSRDVLDRLKSVPEEALKAADEVCDLNHIDNIHLRFLTRLMVRIFYNNEAEPGDIVDAIVMLARYGETVTEVKE